MGSLAVRNGTEQQRRADAKDRTAHAGRSTGYMKQIRYIVVLTVGLMLNGCSESPKTGDQPITFRIDSNGYWHSVGAQSKELRGEMSTAHRPLGPIVLECSQLTPWSTIQEAAQMVAGAERITINLHKPSDEEMGKYLESIEVKTAEQPHGATTP